MRRCASPASRSTGSSRCRTTTRPRSSSERARAVGRELAPDATVEAICRRLDGFPLAVELAAARTKLLAPERLLERLDSALPLLTGGARDAPERQRTLRATIEWSYDLLDPDARELFARLAVFAGAFPLEAAEEICGADLDGLAALVDSSLVKPVGDDRFLMLETIGEYARERLEDAGADELRRRHARYFAAVAEEAYRHRFDAEAEWSARLELDHDDLRAALDWLEQHDAGRRRSSLQAHSAGSGSLAGCWTRAPGVSRTRSRHRTTAAARAPARSLRQAPSRPDAETPRGPRAARGGARAVARAGRP